MAVGHPPGLVIQRRFVDYLSDLPNRSHQRPPVRKARLPRLRSVLDPLTRLQSGGEMEARLQSRLDGNPAEPCAILVFSLNRFRRINDLLGYRAGDVAVAEVAHRLRGWLTDGAIAGRIGGDEFAVALPGFGRESAAASAVSLLEIFDEPLRIADHEFHLTAGIGFTVFPAGGLTASVLLRRAAHARDRAKLRGGNAVEWNLGPETTFPEEGFRLESALRGALDREEVSLRYQPQVDRDGNLRGLEALAVWNSSLLGHVDTETFIRLAEETGAILEIGEWVLERACRQVAEWRASGFDVPRVAVNVAAQQFASPNFVATVRRVLRSTGIGGESLELEITESSILGDLDESALRMADLRKLGVRIAIDDFGVGYSPLAYLHRLPLDAVKVDRSFVRQITQPSGSLPVVHTITVLAHHRGLQVVAEGVETESELELVRAARCDLVQGYLIGNPMNPTELMAMMASPEQLSERARARSASHY